MSTSPGDSATPTITVVSGCPTDGEIAALVGALLATGQPTPAPTPSEPVDTWASPSVRHRSPLPPPGRMAWIQAVRNF